MVGVAGTSRDDASVVKTMLVLEGKYYDFVVVAMSESEYFGVVGRPSECWPEKESAIECCVSGVNFTMPISTEMVNWNESVTTLSQALTDDFFTYYSHSTSSSSFVLLPLHHHRLFLLLLLYIPICLYNLFIWCNHTNTPLRFFQNYNLHTKHILQNHVY